MLNRVRLPLVASVLVAVAIFPMLLSWTGPVHADRTKKRSSCGCGDAKQGRSDSLLVVSFLYPRWSWESLRTGEDFAYVFVDIPELPADFYLLRMYVFEEKAFATLVDRRGKETLFDASFTTGDGRGLQITVNLLGGPADGDSHGPGGGGSGDPPSALEMDLTCGDNDWITIEWTNEDGSKGYWAECCDGEC